jgi:hypothetical protein
MVGIMVYYGNVTKVFAFIKKKMAVDFNQLYEIFKFDPNFNIIKNEIREIEK